MAELQPPVLMSENSGNSDVIELSLAEYNRQQAEILKSKVHRYFTFLAKKKDPNDVDLYEHWENGGGRADFNAHHRIRQNDGKSLLATPNS